MNIFGNTNLDDDAFKQDNTQQILQQIGDVQKMQESDRTGEHRIKAKRGVIELPTISTNFNDLKIKEIKSNKQRIPQRSLMKQNVIPRFPGVVIICGGIGSGKSTFFHNLLTRPEFYGISYEGVKEGKLPKPYYDVVFLFTGSDDDMTEQLIDGKILKEEHIKHSPTPSDIQRVIDIQMAGIKRDGLEKSPRVLIILEDLVDDLKLMRSKALRSLFIRPRQMNMQVVIMAQYLRFIPPGLRRQAMNLFIFGGDRKSTEIICEEFCPGNMKINKFMRLIAQCQEKRPEDQFPFLHINKRVGVKERFRRNLDTIINI